VEAAQAIEKALARPDALKAEDVVRAQQVLREEQDKIGEVAVSTDVKEGVVEVDNVQAAKLPLDHPLDVASGPHVIGVVSAGYAPSRHEVLVAGHEQVAVHLDLVAIEGLLSHIALHGLVPAADVFVATRVSRQVHRVADAHEHGAAIAELEGGQRGGRAGDFVPESPDMQPEERTGQHPNRRLVRHDEHDARWVVALDGLDRRDRARRDGEASLSSWRRVKSRVAHPGLVRRRLGVLDVDLSHSLPRAVGDLAQPLVDRGLELQEPRGGLDGL
jgi:hypothetical protein